MNIELTPLIEGIGERHFFLDEIEYIAKLIKEFGEKYSIEILIAYGKNLMKYSRSCDIESVEEMLQSYFHVVERIKALSETVDESN